MPLFVTIRQEVQKSSRSEVPISAEAAKIVRFWQSIATAISSSGAKVVASHLVSTLRGHAKALHDRILRLDFSDMAPVVSSRAFPPTTHSKARGRTSKFWAMIFAIYVATPSSIMVSPWV